MRTLGIDLAAQDKKTAWCAIEWISGRALVELPLVGGSTDELMTAMRKANWIGIDAPFGWPDTMVEAIHRYAEDGVWPRDAVAERVRYRMTDWFVHELIADERDVSVWPLSVSSDRIAVCAWRCANLLTEYASRTGRKLDRIGVPLGAGADATSDAPRPTGILAANGVVEVYPAAALALWGFAFKGYKRNSGATANIARERRIGILEDLERAAGAWLILSDDVREACIDNDDALDAVISSLVARAAAIGKTLRPTVDQRAAARREGWIHLPSPGSIGTLAPEAA